MQRGSEWRLWPFIFVCFLINIFKTVRKADAVPPVPGGLGEGCVVCGPPRVRRNPLPSLWLLCQILVDRDPLFSGSWQRNNGPKSTCFGEQSRTGLCLGVGIVSPAVFHVSEEKSKGLYTTQGGGRPAQGAEGAHRCGAGPGLSADSLTASPSPLVHTLRCVYVRV